MGHFSSIRIASIPISEASHSISKVLLKSGKDSKCVKINFFFNKLKAFSCSSPHLKSMTFLTISINEEATILKSSTNLL